MRLILPCSPLFLFPSPASSLLLTFPLHLRSAHPGHFAAQAIANPSAYAGRHIKLAGDELTVEEMRQAYERVQNTSVWRAHLPSFTVNWLSYDFKQMFLMFREKGYTANPAECRKEHPGMQTFETYLRSGSKSE
jgi:hypothetical protein